MNRLLIVLGLLVSTSAFSAQPAGAPYPQNPVYQLTPGSLCAQPTEYRYPERIPYCERQVSSQAKVEIIRMYDQRLGYRISQMNRQEFKIDHYVPLCMGGSNGVNNLWPQHQTVYQYTDPLEPVLCDKMSQGRLKQKDAIDLIRRAKANLAEVARIFQYAQSL